MRRHLTAALAALAVLVFVGTAQAATVRPLLFVLAGQSNMVGHGFPVPFAVVSPRIERVTLANTLEPAGPVLGERGDPSIDGSGAGPGLPFARTIIRHDSKARVVLLMCAVGGTSIAAWQPGQQFYDRCTARTKAALKFGRLAGVLFLQGETDAASAAPNWWLPDFMSYTTAVRATFGRVPIVFGQIGTIDGAPGQTEVRREQAAVVLPCSRMVTTTDLPTMDGVHFTTPAYGILGQRFARAWQATRFCQ
jgi:hypothetical protein